MSSAAAAAPRRPEPFLPQININKSRKDSGSPQLRRLKKVKDSVQTASAQTAQTISEEDVALFRNSVKQNICVEMLREGNHRSFSELFSLCGSDQARRSAAGPGSDVWRQPALQDQPDKLQTLQLHLSRAEHAERTGSWSVAFEQRLSLARFFSSPQDRWLSLHFYRSSLDRVGRLPGGRPLAQARANMADAYLEQGVLEEARRQAELCVQESEAGGCWDLKPRACQTLWRICGRLADGAHDDAERLQLLQQAHGSAAHAADQRMEGEAAYRLALAYQSAGEHATAKQFLTTCMEICSSLQDADGLGKAYKAMAKSMEREGKLDDTVQFLEKFSDVSSSSDLKHNLQDACMCQGSIYYSRAQYDRAFEFFQRGYHAACELHDEALVQRAQVLLGSARAHSLIGTFSADMMEQSGDSTSS
ncbi:tetratricopeptide repeat protein 29 [Myripristis murdjan]|uniref:tetratricopeptide repeat protein 29 n=1 Tax=Myripristis murdjan TaxID=586833 RepID=UPI001175FCAD|nr:tetratricopeptide repeat protein 29 [Myripristis murdjan]XP_029931834.1 tetratricopeptide repeat protein 29 [Myripristis murdjan]